MNVYPTSAECCPALESRETAVLERILRGPSDAWERRGHPAVRKRAKRIWHRIAPDVWLWHWGDAGEQLETNHEVTT